MSEQENETMNQRMAVIGAGTMGRGITQAFLQAGFEVWLHDALSDVMTAASDHIHNGLDRSAKKGKLSS